MKTTMMTVLSILATATPAFAADVTVIVEEARSEAGKVRCGLHTSGAKFPNGAPAQGVEVRVEKGQARCVFTDVKPGVYAVAVLHDINGNGTMDSSWVGAPEEPWGVSKNAPAHTFGPPEFDEAKVTVKDAPMTLRIRLNQP